GQENLPRAMTERRKGAAARAAPQARSERLHDRVYVDLLVVVGELIAPRVRLDLGGIERIRLVDEVVLDHVLNLEVALDLADGAAGVEEELPAFENVEAPLFALVPAAGKHVGELHLGFCGNRRIHLLGEPGELLHHDLRRRARVEAAELETGGPALQITRVD